MLSPTGCFNARGVSAHAPLNRGLQHLTLRPVPGLPGIAWLCKFIDRKIVDRKFIDRKVIGLAALSLLVAAPLASWAQSGPWPNRPVRFIVPFLSLIHI